MAEHPSFIEARGVFVDYSYTAGVLGKLLGKRQMTHSVLRNLNLQLLQGAHVTLFGSEGTGKSTFLRLLAGAISPTSGSLLVNGQSPAAIKDLAAGYISAEETEPAAETVHDILVAFGTTHQINNVPARISELSDVLGLAPFLHIPAGRLSTAQRLRINLARAALSDSPLILLDDVADALGIKVMRDTLATLFAGRTCIISTRFVATAEALDLPILLLHNGTLVHTGTCDEIANSLACPRLLDVWVEGLRYDLLRKLRNHPGVNDVRLLPSSRFAGQKLRITLKSSRYLPSIYDAISQAPLVRVQELPPSLADIVARL